MNKHKLNKAINLPTFGDGGTMLDLNYQKDEED